MQLQLIGTARTQPVRGEDISKQPLPNSFFGISCSGNRLLIATIKETANAKMQQLMYASSA